MAIFLDVVFGSVPLLSIHLGIMLLNMVLQYHPCHSISSVPQNILFMDPIISHKSQASSVESNDFGMAFNETGQQQQSSSTAHGDVALFLRNSYMNNDAGGMRCEILVGIVTTNTNHR
jgi:hypothetical protein